MPRSHPEKDKVFHHLRIGTNNLVTQILTCGVDASDFHLVALCNFDELAEENQQAQRMRDDVCRANNMIISLILAEPERRSDAGGIRFEAIATYLKRRTKRSE